MPKFLKLLVELLPKAQGAENMINYLQTITVFGLRTGLQRAAARKDKTQAIQTDNNKTFAVGGIQSLKEVEISTALNEDRLEERKHGLRTPQNEEKYLLATHIRNMLLPPLHVKNISWFKPAQQLTGLVVDIVV
ncbi:MAG: hypothetical protein HQL68_10835 [Magnetococcales bacterium]|nr:hypothetical protein [Magnetococcales bacterium]